MKNTVKLTLALLIFVAPLAQASFSSSMWSGFKSFGSYVAKVCGKGVDLVKRHKVATTVVAAAALVAGGAYVVHAVRKSLINPVIDIDPDNVYPAAVLEKFAKEKGVYKPAEDKKTSK